MTHVTSSDLQLHRAQGPWRELERIAATITQDLQARHGAGFQPVLGGGTRLMLELNHRISDDIDLFIRDPQWLGYISPRLNDRVLDVTDDYEEASDFLKLRLPQGEIDFVVRGSLLGLPHDSSDETAFPLEAPAEVLAKKLFYRGAMLTPRDLFDWWALETQRPQLIPRNSLGALLLKKAPGIAGALDALASSKVAQQRWHEIRTPTLPALADTLAWAKGQLSAYTSHTDKRADSRQTSKLGRLLGELPSAPPAPEPDETDGTPRP